MSIKYYLYLSESKVEMLYSQIPRAFLSGLSGELKVSLGVLSTTLRQGSEAETKFAKLSAVVRYLEEHNAVGTVEQPGDYFKATMSMKWGPYDEHFDKPSPLVYFGGMSTETILGLGGSASMWLAQQDHLTHIHTQRRHIWWLGSTKASKCR